MQIALGCTDEATAKFLSDRTGEITIGVQSTARQLSSWQVSNYTPQYRETSGLGRRKLMTMDEILRMPLDQELVIIRGHNVLQCEKFDYSLHPDAQQLVKSRASEYIPAWRAEEERSPAPEPLEEKEAAKQSESGVPEPPAQGRNTASWRVPPKQNMTSNALSVLIPHFQIPIIFKECESYAQKKGNS